MDTKTTTRDDVTKAKILALLARKRCRTEAELLARKDHRENYTSDMRLNLAIEMLCFEEKVSLLKMVIAKIDSVGTATGMEYP
jgi:hypothetical protein